MPAKNIYLPDDVIKYIDKQRQKETRTFSNYLVKLIREEMKRRQGNERYARQ